MTMIIKKHLTDSEIDFYSRNARCLFQDYPWISLWEQVFKQDGQYVICKKNETILAVFPFYTTKNADHRFRFLRWNEMRLMATGLTISTDYADFPAIKDTGSIWGDDIARFLEEIPDWDVIRLSDVLEDSNAFTLFEALRSRGYRTIVINRSNCPYFDLDFENVDAFIRTKPKTFRKNLMKRVRNINAQSEIRYESDVTAENWEMLFDNLVRLHNIRKEAKGIVGKFGDPSYTRFHRDAFQSYASSGQLFVPRLMDGEKIIAIRYAYIDRGVYYGYQSGMDPTYGVFSPGSVLTYYIVDDLIKRGVHRFDFLRGDEKYKYNWTSDESVLKDLLVFRKNPKGLIIFAYVKTLNKLKENKLVLKVREFFGKGKQDADATEKKGEE